MIRLSIIIPAYNEEKRIANTLQEYLEFFSEIYKKDFEILVILNGCKDNTLDIVKGYEKRYPQLKYEDIKEAIGKGGAIIEGFKIAQGKLIGFVDADNSTKPSEFYDLVKNMDEKHDGVIASRWLKESKLPIKQPKSRIILGRSYNFMVRLLFRLKLKDTQCGAKLFTKESIKTVIPRLNITRWGFDVNLLYVLKRHGYKIKEIPTTWYDDPRSNLKKFKTTLEMFLSLIRLRLIYSPFKFIVKIYDKLPEGIKIHHRM